MSSTDSPSMRSSMEPSLMRDSLSSMPPAPKRRAFSVSADRSLYRGASSSASAARRAVSSAFSNVSRLVKSSSTTTTPSSSSTSTSTSLVPGDATDQELPPTRGRANTYSATISSWKLSSKLPQVPASLKSLRRPRQQSSSATVSHWEHGRVQYVSSSYAHHGEDAGALSSYYHIVADGISAPFAGQPPESVPADAVSSAIIAQALVKAVESALEDLTNRNKEATDAAGFEHAVCDAIHAARAQCMHYRASRIATTLCVVYFDRWSSTLRSFTLGDSKTIVVRKGDIVFESTCTVREFNVPCVVNLVQPLEPNDFLVESCELEKGDLCLTFSDGIGDNVYKGDVLQAVDALERGELSLQQFSDTLVAQSTLDGVLPPISESEPESGEQSHTVVDQEASATDATTASTVEPEAESGDQPVIEEPITELRERLHSASMEDSNETTATTDTQPAQPTPPPVRQFYPFATAAAYEYRRRVLRQRSVATPEQLADKNFQRHLRDSALLLDLHDGKLVMDRQVLIAKANRRPHYSLVQLHRMAQIRAKKPDDVTLHVTRFG